MLHKTDRPPFVPDNPPPDHHVPVGGLPCRPWTAADPIEDDMHTESLPELAIATNHESLMFYKRERRCGVSGKNPCYERCCTGIPTYLQHQIMDRHNQHDEDAFESTFQAYKRRRGF